VIAKCNDNGPLLRHVKALLVFALDRECKWSTVNARHVARVFFPVNAIS